MCLFFLVVAMSDKPQTSFQVVNIKPLLKWTHLLTDNHKCVFFSRFLLVQHRSERYPFHLVQAALRSVLQRKNNSSKMKVSVANLEGALFSLEVSPDIELENFKVLVEVEAGLPSSQCVILFNGRPMMDMKKTLSGYGVADGDVLLLQPMMMRPPQAQQQAPGEWDGQQFSQEMGQS